MYRVIPRVIVPAALAVAALGGCVTHGPAYSPAQGAVLGAPTTVDYPGGRYRLYGDGTAASPHYWVWIPTGATPPPPPALPPARVASNATEGHYQLYGDGSSAAPYYWVRVPAGVSVATPPPPPRRPYP
jgi:hypothetical protein